MNSAAHQPPTVSILMNCFNGEKFIAEAISSVLAQSYTDYELVIWDNRSTDHSREIVHGFDDARILLVDAPVHTDLSAARKSAFPHLRGQWIAILDVDDLWRPDKLEKQMAVAHGSPECGFVYCRTGVINENHAPEGSLGFAHPISTLPVGNIYGRLLRGNFISIASLLIRRSCLESIGGFSGRYPIMEDYYVTLNIARRYPVAAVDEVLCDYRVHGSNASLNGPIDTFEDLNIVKQHLPSLVAVRAIARIIARHFKKCLMQRRRPQVAQMLNALV